MDNRLSFVDLFLEDNYPIYYDNNASPDVRRVYQYWRSLGYSVEKWSGDKQGKYLYFYKSRFVSETRSTSDVNEYIIVPSVKRPRWIILNQKDVISKHGSIIKPTSIKARFIWGLAKALNKFNLFALVFPDRFIARRAQMASTVFNKVGYKPSILYTGAPGKYQKFTIQYNDEQSNAAYFLKVSNTSGGIERLENECSALNELGSYELEYVKSPSLSEDVRCNGFYGIVQSNILDNEKISIQLSNIDIMAISELYNSFGFRKVCLSEYLSQIGFPECADKLSMLVEYFMSLKEKRILLSISHGDYIPWNRFVSPYQVKVIDWETFRYRPIFYDICYFLVHKALLVENRTVISAVMESVDYISDLLTQLKGGSIAIEDDDIEFYILINLVELYLHYKSNDHEDDGEFLLSIRIGINTLQKKLII